MFKGSKYAHLMIPVQKYYDYSGGAADVVAEAAAARVPAKSGIAGPALFLALGVAVGAAIVSYRPHLEKTAGLAERGTTVMH